MSKVIRILETLISIILMNLAGGLHFFFFFLSGVDKERKNTGFLDFWEISG